MLSVFIHFFSFFYSCSFLDFDVITLEDAPEHHQPVEDMELDSPDVHQSGGDRDLDGPRDTLDGEFPLVIAF